MRETHWKPRPAAPPIGWHRTAGPAPAPAARREAPIPPARILGAHPCHPHRAPDPGELTVGEALYVLHPELFGGIPPSFYTEKGSA